MKNLGKTDRKAWLGCLYPVIFISIGLFGYLLNTSNNFTSIPGDLGDARFNSVVLEHLYQWVSGDASYLWSPSYFYPFKWVLTFSDNHFGSAWSYIFFRSLEFTREKAYLSWFFVGTLLNFICSYWALRKLDFSSLSSAIGAFVYAFSLPALSLEMHAQLVYRFAVPLAFTFLIQYLLKSRASSFAWCCVWTLIQFLCSIYVGVFLLYLLGAAFLVWLCFLRQKPPRSKSPRSSLWLKPPGLIASVSILLIAVLLAVYGVVAHYYGFSRPNIETLSMTPHFASYFLADRSGLTAWVGSWVHSIPPHLIHEQQMFFGLGVWVILLSGLLGVFLQGIHKQLGILALGSLLVLFVLTLSIFNISAYRLVLYIPGVSSVRAVSRIILVMLLPIGILAAIGVDYLSTRRSNIYAFLIPALLLVPEVLAYKPYTTPISQWVERRETVRNLLAGSASPDDILFVSSKNNAQYFLAELDGMILAQDLKIPTLNGYSGNVPAGHIQANPCGRVEDRIEEIKKSDAQLNSKLLARHLVKIELDGPCNVGQ